MDWLGIRANPRRPRSGIRRSEPPCGSLAVLAVRSHPPRKGFTQPRVGVLKRTHQAMRWLTTRLRRRQHPRQVVPGAAVGDLDHFGDTAHPTQSGLERDNTPAECRSRRAAPPCPAWPASRDARAHRADFSWTAHLQGLHGYTADICQLSIHGRVSPSSAVGGLRSRGRFSRRLQLGPGLVPPSSWSLSPCNGLEIH